MRSGIRGFAAVAGLCLGSQIAVAQHASHMAPAKPVIEVPAPGYGELGFAVPEAGSYPLASLGAAADGEVLGTDGHPLRLHKLMGDRIAVLSFIYGSCHDVNGCPLANAVLRRIQRRLREHADLSAELRLITLSFDPTRDTPVVMKRHREILTGGEAVPEWVFLTTESDAKIAPILTDYGQAIVREPSEPGSEAAAPISHNLKVFLIDRQREIRNVYGVSFLHPDTLIADLRTLLLAEKPEKAQGRHAHHAAHAKARKHAEREEARIGPGDVRTGYETKAFVTRSRAILNRNGATLNLLQRAQSPLLGLPPLERSVLAELSEERIALGRTLFFDRRLSANGTFSCAMCHIPEQGYTNNELATPIGFEGRTVRRNAPTLFNVGYRTTFFHDAREPNLEDQIWGPLLARNEMANASEAAVLKLISEIEEYRDLFSAAYPERGLTRDTLGAALASYQRTLLSGDSAFDRWHYGGNPDAASAAARRGFELFRGKAGCVGCHSVGAESASFTDEGLHNTGVGAAPPDTTARTRRVQVSPGVTVDVPVDIIAAVSEAKRPDLGRFEVTGEPRDRWKYKTPSLRDVALTAPYMHDGSLRTLEAVVEFYNRGGIPNPGLDPLLRPLGLSNGEKSDLVAFLDSLTSSDPEALVRDAFAAPIGDVEDSR